jgi:predicted PurR-regulated permease PerM
MENNNEAHYNRAILTALRISFIALLLVWSFFIIKPFIMLVLWGIIIAVALYPLFKKLAKKLGGREKLSATIITIVGLALIISPFVMMVNSTVDSLHVLSSKMKDGTLEITPPKESVAELPVIGKPLYDSWNLASNNLDKAMETFGPQIKEMAPKVVNAATDLAGAVLLFVVSIIIAGALFTQAKPAERAASSIFNTLVGEQGKGFVQLSVAIIRSVVQGILGIAAIQSLLAGIGMSVAGIPGAGLLAILVLFLAIMQLPPILVLGPVAAYSFTIMDTTGAIIFTVYLLVVSVSDAFLKPLLLGRGVDVPMLAVLLGAIGGMIMSGIIGLFVGAVVLTIAYKVFEALLVEDVLENASDIEDVIAKEEENK